MADAPVQPAVLVISRVMRPGRADCYDPWVARVEAAVQARDGARSTVRLDQAGGLHHLLLQFSDAQALKAWRERTDYAALREEADTFSVGLDQTGGGPTAHFTIPSEAAAPKWKSALVTWVGVVPTLLVLSSTIGWLLPDAPRIAKQLISSVLLTVILTWLILPRVRGWSRFWMLRGSGGSLRRKPG